MKLVGLNGLSFLSFVSSIQIPLSPIKYKFIYPLLINPSYSIPKHFKAQLFKIPSLIAPSPLLI